MHARGALVVALVLLPSAVAGQDAGRDLRLVSFTSRTFGNTRTLRILLPSGYEAPENRGRRYPVLYLNDGQNLFDAATSTFTGREWRVDETVRELTAAGRIPPLIVVGIDHAGAKRGHEFLPYKNYAGEPDMDEPAGKQFPDFVVNEVMPRTYPLGSPTDLPFAQR